METKKKVNNQPKTMSVLVGAGENQMFLNWNSILQELKKPLTEVYGKNIVVKTEKAITHKGYDTTGYNYQYIVNRLNEVLSSHRLDWSTQDKTEIVREYVSKSGQTWFEAVSNPFTILILTSEGTVISRRTCCGGHQSSTKTDALKGAFTNAIKKTAAMYGVGADAYEGTVDEDFLPIEEPTNNPVVKAAGNGFALTLTLDETKAIEKEMTAVSNAINNEQLKVVEDSLKDIVGKVGGKQLAYLRKLIESKSNELDELLRSKTVPTKSI